MVKVTNYRTGFTPKPTQLRFAMALALGKDVTCVVATGFGKSLAFQMEIRNHHHWDRGTWTGPLQVEACAKFKLKAISLNEGEGAGE